MASLFSSNRTTNQVVQNKMAQFSKEERTISDPFSPAALEDTLRFLQDKQLLVPALLWLTAHRPLAFLASQALLLLAPSATLLGIPNLSGWVALLSHPVASDWLERRLKKQSHSPVNQR